ncbi:MAG: hypothetical protein HZA53_07675 [Planctomycetes bacterium]|nr:hypothetical protein [Planctomycetota bacterium]
MRSGGRGPDRAALAAAFVLSALIACAPFPPDVEGAFSRLAASALPWIALAGVPLARLAAPSVRHRALPPPDSGHVAPPLAFALVWTGAALAPLCVAARLDLEDGLALAWILAVLALVLGEVFALAFAAARGAGGRVHALAWAACVPLPALLGGVLALFAEAAPSACAAWTPLCAAWNAARNPEAEFGFVEVLAPIALALLLAALPGVGRTVEAVE